MPCLIAALTSSGVLTGTSTDSKAFHACPYDRSVLGTVLEKAPFLKEGVVERFQDGDFRSQRLYELQLEFLSCLFSVRWDHQPGFWHSQMGTSNSIR